MQPQMQPVDVDSSAVSHASSRGPSWADATCLELEESAEKGFDDTLALDEEAVQLIVVEGSDRKSSRTSRTHESDEHVVKQFLL